MNDFKLLAAYFSFEERGLQTVIRQVQSTRQQIQTLTAGRNTVAIDLQIPDFGNAISVVANATQQVEQEVLQATNALQRFSGQNQDVLRVASAFDAVEDEAQQVRNVLRGVERDISQISNRSRGLRGNFSQITNSVSQITGVGGGLGGGLSAAGGLAALGPQAVTAAAGLGTLFVAYKALKTGLFSAVEIEQQKVAFETIIGNAQQAATVFRQLEQFANITPFETPEVLRAGKALLSFGVSAGNVTDELRRIGDVASGISVPLNEIAVIYGKARVQGRLFAQDINELQGRGIPVYTELAKVFGKSTAEIRKMVEQGEVGFNDLRTVFINLTSEGGQFFGLMEKQSQTLGGLWSTLKSEFVGLLRDAVQPIVPVVKGIVQGTIAAIRVLRQAFDEVRQFVTDFSDSVGPSWLFALGPVLGTALTLLRKTKQELQQDVALPDVSPEVDSVSVKQLEADAKAAKAAMEDLKRESERLRQEGQSLRDSLRTPFESARDDLSRYSFLLQRGAIDHEVFNRAVRKTQKELFEATQQARELQKQVGAGSLLQRGSAAEFNFRLEDQRETEQQIALQRRDLEIQTQQYNALTGILTELETQRNTEQTVEIPIAELN